MAISYFVVYFYIQICHHYSCIGNINSTNSRLECITIFGKYLVLKFLFILKFEICPKPEQLFYK